MGDRAAHVTDYDAVAHPKALPLEHQLGTTESGVAARNDSATGNIGFMDQNNKLDEEYALPGGGANSNASWVSSACGHINCEFGSSVYTRCRQPECALQL